MDENIGGLDFTVGEVKEGGFSDLAEAVYNVILKSIKKETAPFGEVIKWTFELIGEQFSYGDNEGNKKQRIVTGTTSPLCNPNTKLYEWYSKLVGKEPGVGEKIQLSVLFGKQCQVLTKNNTSKKADDNGKFRVYSNVDRLISVVSTVAQSAPKVQQVNIPQVKEVPVQEITKPAETEVFPQSKVEPNAEKSADEGLFDDIF